MTKMKKAKVVVFYIIGYAAILFTSYCGGYGLSAMIQDRLMEKES